MVNISEPGNICDFCSDTPIRWRYPAKDYEVESVGIEHLVGSAGDWAACGPCHDLIEAEDWAELARRSTQRLLQKHGMQGDDPHALEVIRRLQNEFRIHRTGSPRAVLFFDK